LLPGQLPKILCLEELDYYWTFFQKELGNLGYDSVYHKRPSVHVSSWSGKQKHDGCGIFFQRDTYDLLWEQCLTYDDIHDRVGLIVLLKNKHNNKYLIVGSTHLYWDEKLVDVQLSELKELDVGIGEMKQYAEANFGVKEIPILIGGDFNNGPRSVIYKYMSTEFGSAYGVKMRSAYDIYGHLNPKEADKILPKEGQFGEAFEAPYSTVNYRRSWTIDYCWYSQSLTLTHLLEIPPERELRLEPGPDDWIQKENDQRKNSGKPLLDETQNLNGIPNSKHGSDHIPLLAVFK